MQDESPLGDSTDFTISLGLGLSGEEHLSLAGLAKSRRSSKALLKSYEDAEEELAAQNQPTVQTPAPAVPEQAPVAEPPGVENDLSSQDGDEDAGPAPGQMTLF